MADVDDYMLVVIVVMSDVRKSYKEPEILARYQISLVVPLFLPVLKLFQCVIIHVFTFHVCDGLPENYVNVYYHVINSTQMVG